MTVFRPLYAALALTLIMGGSAIADDDTPDAEETRVKGPDCLDLIRIHRTEIVDDQTILFHMKGGKTYVSNLPHRCFGLRFERGFVYSTSLPKICGNVDFITVIRRGNSCALGPFYEYEEPAEEQQDETEADNNVEG